jgi:hypothetical protein
VVYWQTTRMRPPAAVSFLHVTGREGSARPNGAFTTAGFHTLTPVCVARAGAGDEAGEAKLGPDATGAGSAGAGSCWNEGVASEGVDAPPGAPGSDIGLASTTEPSEVRVQPAVTPQHAAAAMGSHMSLLIPPT